MYRPSAVVHCRPPDATNNWSSPSPTHEYSALARGGGIRHNARMPCKDDHESLQRLIETLYRDNGRVLRLDFIVRAELTDMTEDVLDIVNLLPPGYYTRNRLCDQLNSAITAHGWGRSLGTVE